MPGTVPRNKAFEGYMPFKSQWGFAFYNGTTSTDGLGKLVAHELGHGAFRLEHITDPPTSNTDNLMDYADGIRTYHSQWDYIYDPSWKLYLFGKAEDAAGIDALTARVFDKAKELTTNLGNVYAVIHCFELDEKVAEYSSAISSSITDGRQPIYLQSIYSEANKVQCNILYFEFSKDKVSGTAISKNYNFLEDVKSSFKTAIDSKAPYLAVVEPESKLYKDCTPCVGNLDAEARKALSDNNYETYYIDLLSTIKKCVVKHTALFVNGYRFSFPENKNTTNDIYESDIVDNGKSYWVGIDEKFKERLNPDFVYYADGHMSISTSNHKTIENFYCSAKNSIDAFPASATEAGLKYGTTALELIPVTGTAIGLLASDIACARKGQYLNTEANTGGFKDRIAQGVIAGNVLLKKMQANENITKAVDGKIIDTLDIICHSMGYAYALGMIQSLQNHVSFGRFYIIAPENAESGGPPSWGMFSDVWQYGYNEKETPYHIEKQDGVAPQTKALGLSDTRRVYIPTDGSVPVGFVSSHSIGNFGWIFDININIKGYVETR